MRPSALRSRDDARREPFLRGVGRSGGPDLAATGRDADRHRDDAPGRRERCASPQRSEAMTLGNLPPETSRYATWYFRPTTPGPKTFLIRACVGERGRVPRDEDGAGRFRHEPGADRDGDEPVGAASGRPGRRSRSRTRCRTRGRGRPTPRRRATTSRPTRPRAPMTRCCPARTRSRAWTLASSHTETVTVTIPRGDLAQ